jgi:hypothetical protein
MRKYNGLFFVLTDYRAINGIWLFHYKNYFCEKLKAGADYMFRDLPLNLTLLK